MLVRAVALRTLGGAKAKGGGGARGVASSALGGGKEAVEVVGIPGSNVVAVRPETRIPVAEFERQMGQARFGLFTRGDTPTSVRLYDLLALSVIPIVVADGIEEVGLPFKCDVDWAHLAFWIRNDDFIRAPVEMVKQVLAKPEAELRRVFDTVQKKRTASSLMKQWQSRFFELAGHYLKYYGDKGKDELKGTVDIASMTDIAVSGTQITIEVQGKKILLKGKSPQEAELWEAEIRGVWEEFGQNQQDEDPSRKDSYKAGNMSARQKAQLREWALKEFEDFKDEDFELFMISSLNELCDAKGLLGDNLSKEDLKAIFENVKVKKKFLGEEQFLDALRHIAQKREQTFDELVLAISGKSLDEVDVAADAEADEVAPQSRKEDFAHVAKLGAGGQGTTVLVKHTATNNRYAAKLITCADLSDARMANQEAKLMKDMSGPHFVEFKDSFIVKGSLNTYEMWIVMKYYEKGDLAKLVGESEGKKLPEAQLAKLVTPVLEGLRQMHAESMMHRDIKPANILISDDGESGLIADFGLAKYNEHVSKTAHHGQTMTRGIGTAKYMAPEIAEGEYSATVDIWAFGMVLLVCTGVSVLKPLHTREEVDAAVAQIPTDEYSEGLRKCIRAALTVKKAPDTLRPSALDLLGMPFFAPYYNDLPEAMFQNAIRLANKGPWAVLSSVRGLNFTATSNGLVQISRCKRKPAAGGSGGGGGAGGDWESAAAVDAAEKLQDMVSNIPGNETFAEDYDVTELVIAKSQLRGVQLVNKLQDLDTKYAGLRPQHQQHADTDADTESADAYHPFRLPWESEAEVASRRKIIEYFVKYQSLCAKEFPNVRVMLAFHIAGSADVCEKMLAGNFAVFAVLDAGYYGQGIYVTTDLDYAVGAYGRDEKTGEIRDELHVVFCFIVIGNSFPVIECPFKSDQATTGLYGKPITPKADSHLVVVASDPVANIELGEERKKKYLPSPSSTWGQTVEVQGVGEKVPLVNRAYTEIALRDESQILPAGYMTIRPTKAKREELADAASKAMGSLGRLAVSNDDGSTAMAYFDKAVELSTERTKPILLAERARLHSANGDHAKAIEDLQAALVVREDWFEGQVQLAEACQADGRLEQALETFEAVVRAKEDTVMEYFGKVCVIAQQMGRELRELRASSSHAFSAKVFTLDGKETVVPMVRTQTVGALKQQLEKRAGAKVKQQQLSLMHGDLGGTELSDDEQTFDKVLGEQALANGYLDVQMVVNKPTGFAAWATGFNDKGQLGLGHTTDQSTPVEVTAVGKTVRAVVCGSNHTMFVREDGSVWATGSNEEGQLGLGHEENQSTPVEVTAMGKTVRAVVCGDYHTMFVREDGSVWATGYNHKGQLGLGHERNQSTPVEVTAVGKTVRAVVCGAYHTMFVREDGSVWATGKNDFGQLGLGHTTSQETPVEVTAVGKTVRAVGCGEYHTMFVREDGSVWGTGYNHKGQLGLGHKTNQSTPMEVTAVGKTVRALVCGEYHTMFVREDGSVWATGYNDKGQLGLGHERNQSTPVEVTAVGKTVRAVVCGQRHTMFVREDGSVWASGWNDDGKLGLGHETDQMTPVGVTAVGKTVRAVVCGSNHTMFLQG
eukprot:g1570.t1